MRKVKDFFGKKMALKVSSSLLKQFIKGAGKELQRIPVNSIGHFKEHATGGLRKKIQCRKCGYPKKHEDIAEVHGHLVMFEKTFPNYIWLGEAVCKSCKEQGESS